ncbi:MAG: hypothetical protein HOO96_19245 [Polyangiaceae bacterium]|nr:hypothetical protein [Polyangiaceae bacterium]
MLPPVAGPHAHLRPIGIHTTAERIAAFRARVLFDGGRRPAFHRGDDVYDDADPLDAFAFQVALQADGELVGCIRVNPVSELPPSSMATLLGPTHTSRVLRDLGAPRSTCWDGGRWAVDPARQRSALGGELACAAMAVARYLGGRRLVGVGGVRQGQAARLVSLGAVYVSSCAPVAVPAMDDEVRVVVFDLDCIHPDAIERVEGTLLLLASAWSAPQRTVPVNAPGSVRGAPLTVPRAKR